MALTSRHSRAVAIHGAGSGLGRAVALGFAAKGYIVFGTAASAGEVCELKELSRGRVSLTVCSVNKIDGIRAWVDGVCEALGASGIDILISNVAQFSPIPMELLSLEALRRDFEINVFGTIMVINAFLPSLRRAHGRIVQISSPTASVLFPFNGPSDASMAAMEAFSAIYRAELTPFGIDVVVASVGRLEEEEEAEICPTEVRQVIDAMTPDQRKVYGKDFAAFQKRVHDLNTNGIKLSAAAERIIELAERDVVSGRAPIGSEAERLLDVVREKTPDELEEYRRNPVNMD